MGRKINKGVEKPAVPVLPIFILSIILISGAVFFLLQKNSTSLNPFDEKMDKDEAIINQYQSNLIRLNEDLNYNKYNTFSFRESARNFTPILLNISLSEFTAPTINYAFDHGVNMSSEYQIDTNKVYVQNFTVNHPSVLDVVSVWGSTPGVELNFLIFNASWSHLYSKLLPNSLILSKTMLFPASSGLFSANFTKDLDAKLTDNNTFFLGLSVNSGAFRWAHNNISDTQLKYEVNVGPLSVDFSYRLRLYPPIDLRGTTFHYLENNPTSVNFTIEWDSLSYEIDYAEMVYFKKHILPNTAITIINQSSEPKNIYPEQFTLEYVSEFELHFENYRFEIIVSIEWDFETPMLITPIRIEQNGIFRNITDYTLTKYTNVQIIGVLNRNGTFLLESHRYHMPGYVF